MLMYEAHALRSLTGSYQRTASSSPLRESRPGRADQVGPAHQRARRSSPERLVCVCQ